MSTEVAEQRALRLQNVRYAEREYWDQRYINQPCEFDWFYGYTALRKVVRQFVKRSKLVLHVGCGNSNFQEGMARDGYQVVNTDISEVVIEQMRKKHAEVPGLRYVVSDCRDMPEFLDCQFGSVIDKGTVDALLCSKDAGIHITAMFREISRVLVPGGTFLLITLGGPAHRLPLVVRPEFGWSVQVCLVRRVPDSQFAPSEPGRPIPLNDTPKPLSFIGPLPANPDGSVDGLPEDFDAAHYFFAYACRKAPLVLGGAGLAEAAAAGAGAAAATAAATAAGGRTGSMAEEADNALRRVRLPEGWCNTVRAVAQAIRGELGLPPGILGRGRRVRTTTRASFERQQREREAQAAAAATAMAAAAAGAIAPAAAALAAAAADVDAVAGRTDGACSGAVTATPAACKHALPTATLAAPAAEAARRLGHVTQAQPSGAPGVSSPKPESGAAVSGATADQYAAAAAATARAQEHEAEAAAEAEQQQLLDPLGAGGPAAGHVHASAVDEATAQAAAAATRKHHMQHVMLPAEPRSSTPSPLTLHQPPHQGPQPQPHSLKQQCRRSSHGPHSELAANAVAVACSGSQAAAAWGGACRTARANGGRATSGGPGPGSCDRLERGASGAQQLRAGRHCPAAAHDGSAQPGDAGGLPGLLQVAAAAAADDEELLVVVDDDTCSAPQLRLPGEWAGGEHGLQDSVCGPSGGWSPTGSDSMAALLGQLQLQKQPRKPSPQAQTQTQDEAQEQTHQQEQPALDGPGLCGPASKAATPDASAVAKPAGSTLQHWALQQQALQQCGAAGASAGNGAISFRRLSITVSDAFDVLDKVDGALSGPRMQRPEDSGV
ncbi:hypothetical protein HYH02_011666 [Chlamydomonas schloesseri]|uniref:Methyltransferase type 11 domain-containing protein n=1 Tax=Chlamydomonas schloesseri TaxID=2026947 RepID=A0A835SZG2_9CHLO|nr:hypothetical protein HYH02_011666 [Chlamydomonas schloesseri]|eukprot:KAG2436162.1 hypothetical protein HYH02_011666 [Chlamydomonas schloesseri]